jgi:peptidoglycan hydrolase CwlO-like protein
LNSWFDLIPVFGAVIAIVSISLKAGRILQKLDNVIEDVKELKQEVKEIKAELKEHSKRLTALELSHMISPNK